MFTFWLEFFINEMVKGLKFSAVVLDEARFWQLDATRDHLAMRELAQRRSLAPDRITLLRLFDSKSSAVDV